MENNSISSTVRAMSNNGENNSEEKQYKVHEIRLLTKSAYVLRFDRNEMQFTAGQHLTLGLYGDNQVREYSIYSKEDDPYLEVLIKEVEDGLVSKRLKKTNPGDLLNVDGPFGFFTIDPALKETGKFLFIATGSGIAPFHSIAGTNPSLNYKILHGVRHIEEGYEKESYPEDRYILCTSRDKQGDLNGRVTEYLRYNEIDTDTQVYLCGNCDMIYEVYDMLTSKGLSSDNIRTEVYF